MVNNPFINEKEKRSRPWFAKDHKNWIVEDWSKVIFSGESNFFVVFIVWLYND